MKNDPVSADPPSEMGKTLDPSDWTAFRTQAHRMLDDMLDYVENIGDRPVWQPIPDDVRSRFRSDLPQTSSDLAAVHQEFMSDILPFTTGNVHPGFMGWVHGGGTPVGMLAEMLAAGLNANLGGRDHVPIEVERQIVRWMQQLFGFPEGATGLFVTGPLWPTSSVSSLLAMPSLGFRCGARVSLVVRKVSRLTPRARRIAASKKPWTCVESGAMHCA
jgi:hypothetical protein